MRVPTTALALGFEHTCFASARGRLLCWGQNTNLQLGLGHNRDTERPAAVLALGPDVHTLRSGGFHTCALGGERAAWCWGQGASGRLATGDAFAQSRPTRALLAEDVRDLSLGGQHSCAHHASGRVSCWGQNAFAQLGDGTREDRWRPVPVDIADVTHLSLGGEHTCALVRDRQVFCWGRNFAGQLGDGTREDRASPVRVRGLPDDDAPLRLSCGGGHSCAVLRSGRVACWGQNTDGQLGLERHSDAESIAHHVPGLRSIVQVSLGADFGCALDRAGQVFCWGRATYGQLGDGQLSPDEGPLHRLAPARVDGLPATTEVVSGGCHACARAASGEVFCWGRNHHGQLGDGSRVSRARPRRVALDVNVGAP